MRCCPGSSPSPDRGSWSELQRGRSAESRGSEHLYPFVVTLVVADIDRSGPTPALSVVSDTLITYDDDPFKTRHFLEHAALKLAIGRDDVCVGVAGVGPERMLRRATAATAAAGAPEEVTKALSACRAAGEQYIVAALTGDGPRIWTIDGHGAADLSALGRAWIGDGDAYGTFQRRMSDWDDEPDAEAGFKLMSSMQFLTELATEHSTVGGFTTRVACSSRALRFVADGTWVGPEEMTGRIAPCARGARIEVSGSGDTMSVQAMAGAKGTPGAYGWWIDPWRKGLLYPQHRPWRSELIAAESPEGFIRQARARGQHLTTSYPFPA